MRVMVFSQEYRAEFWSYVDNINPNAISQDGSIIEPYSGWLLQNGGRIEGAMLLEEGESLSVMSIRCNEHLGAAGYISFLLFLKEYAVTCEINMVEYTFMFDEGNGGVNGTFSKDIKTALQICGFSDPEYKTVIFRLEGAAVMGKAATMKQTEGGSGSRVVSFYATSAVQRQKINAEFGNRIPEFLDYIHIRYALPEYSFAVLGEDEKVESFMICTGKGDAEGRRRIARGRARFMNSPIPGAAAKLVQEYKQASNAEPEEIEVSAMYASPERKYDFNLLLYHAFSAFRSFQDRRCVIIINALNPKMKLFIEKLFPMGIISKTYVYSSKYKSEEST